MKPTQRTNNSQQGNKSPKTAQQEWADFLEKISKQKPQPPAIYQILKDSSLGKIDSESITLLFSDEELANKAKGNPQKILNILPDNFRRKRVSCIVDTPTQMQIESPLQTLTHARFAQDNNGKKALEATSNADITCERLYTLLTEKTRQLADENGILSVNFPWRLRVGGMRGFRELLLPVFHPVYGISYIPSASLKGAVLAWARNKKDIEKKTIENLLGTLDGGIGCVQIFDAFPTAPCLDIDMTNPQWHWDKKNLSIIKYKPEPHHLLSMKSPSLIIGINRTKRGTQEDVKIVKGWLEEALKAGIGSRVSAGYGRTALHSSLPHSSSYKFQLWTQGIYGADTEKLEFRPVALRGMLRYWFRTVALGIYSPSQCKELEATLFGTIEPKSKEGTTRISVEFNQTKNSSNNNQKRPDECQGTILLEAKSEEHLKLITQLLQLSSHLGGIGKGSRRPLHWNHPRFRGCHLEITGMQISYNQENWTTFLQKELRDSFLAIHPQGTPGSGNPGTKDNRCQDVLNQQAAIYLVNSPGLKHPRNVQNWSQDGDKSFVRGAALETLYNSPYKGVNRQGAGNAEVGGKLEVPSFVVIKSNFPSPNQSYQAVTIFGTNNSHRADFIKTLKNGNEVIEVFPYPIS
ncbi:MAG: CRISPR-associated protein Cmr6 [Methylacidiphilales bacterium]|nr:CRISPR-associated protein Cmr6 [Candidatus Methylacidiphilales bacterium]NJR18749.1 CRISPR-associated protein Cmr6 [Calothrix sp. CSU_2_0]